MINIIKLKETIYTALASVGTTYEQGYVPLEATYPLIVYSLGGSVDNIRDTIDDVNFPLEVTILDHRLDKNTTAIEGLVNAVDDKLNREHFNGNGFYIYSIRQSILTDLPVEDEFTFRRELNFILRTYVTE